MPHQLSLLLRQLQIIRDNQTLPDSRTTQYITYSFPQLFELLGLLIVYVLVCMNEPRP